MRWPWLALIVGLYPIVAAASAPLLASLFPGRLDRYSALASGLIVFLITWLGALPRNLAWSLGSLEVSSRWAVPATAYLLGLIVAAALMALIETGRGPRST